LFTGGLNPVTEPFLRLLSDKSHWSHSEPNSRSKEI
jgi:hypothetical protein